MRSTNQQWPTLRRPVLKTQSAESESKPPTKESKPPASQAALTPKRNAGDQPKGRWWDSGESSSTESANQCEEVTKQMSYWPAQSSHCYDTPAEQEQFLNPPSYPTVSPSQHQDDQTPDTPKEHHPEEGMELSDTWYNYIIPQSWHISARSSVSYGLYAIVQKHLLLDPPPKSLEFPPLNLPDIHTTHSQTTGHSDRWVLLFHSSGIRVHASTHAPTQAGPVHVQPVRLLPTDREYRLALAPGPCDVNAEAWGGWAGCGAGAARA